MCTKKKKTSNEVINPLKANCTYIYTLMIYISFLVQTNNGN